MKTIDVISHEKIWYPLVAYPIQEMLAHLKITWIFTWSLIEYLSKWKTIEDNRLPTNPNFENILSLLDNTILFCLLSPLVNYWVHEWPNNSKFVQQDYLKWIKYILCVGKKVLGVFFWSMWSWTFKCIGGLTSKAT